MKTDARPSLPARLHSLAVLASLMERLDRQPSSASAEQYRSVARQLRVLLAQAEPDEHLQALLAAAPATAEVYENLHYEAAGLCRSPLESSLNAEMRASAAILRARQPR